MALLPPGSIEVISVHYPSLSYCFYGAIRYPFIGHATFISSIEIDVKEERSKGIRTIRAIIIVRLLCYCKKSGVINH